MGQAKQLIEAATPSGVLIAAAEDLKNRARQGGSQPTMTSDLWLARHILSTVRPDDDEPVTLERLEAEPYVNLDAVDEVLSVELPDYELFLVLENGRWELTDNDGNSFALKSMGHLRRLVAALGE